MNTLAGSGREGPGSAEIGRIPPCGAEINRDIPEMVRDYVCTAELQGRGRGSGRGRGGRRAGGAARGGVARRRGGVGGGVVRRRGERRRASTK